LKSLSIQKPKSLRTQTDWPNPGSKARRGGAWQTIWIVEKNLSTDEWTNRKWREEYEFGVG